MLALAIALSVIQPVTAIPAQAEDAVRRGGSRRSTTQRPPRAKAAPPEESDVNLRAVMSRGYFGRDCPRHQHQLTKWDTPLQFLMQPGGRAQVLVISGKFVAGDADRLRTFLASAGPISEIQLDSGGGDAAEGPKVGKVIRAAGLSTHVASGFACISSCSMAFLGGVFRRIDADAIYGLHTFYNRTIYDRVKDLPNEAARRNFLHDTERSDAILAGEIQLYGQQMGISRSFFTQVMFTQRSQVFISDQRLGQLRAIFLQPKTAEQVIGILGLLIKEGFVPYDSDEDKTEAKDFGYWMIAGHSQEEVDAKLASFISNDFRCIGRSDMSRYNIVNTVSRAVR